MIDWQVKIGEKTTQQDGWHFADFMVQEYLLPQINVGFKIIDEYGDTTFNSDDSRRVKGNIEFIIDGGILDRKSEIQYDSFYAGIVKLPTATIKDCLLRLYAAADLAVKENGSLVFYGD